MERLSGIVDASTESVIAVLKDVLPRIQTSAVGFRQRSRRGPSRFGSEAIRWLFLRSTSAKEALPMKSRSCPGPRLLFLDDDPGRAAQFLTRNPQALWVKTAAECLDRLAEPWDEIHLDHDLGGEKFVSLERSDCGMAVVRRLADEPHPHLATTRFVIHTHNLNAACVMVAHLQLLGYRVVARPFATASSARTVRSRLFASLQRVEAFRAFQRLLHRLFDPYPRRQP